MLDNYNFNVRDLNLKQLRNLYGYSLSYIASKLKITKQGYSYKENTTTPFKTNEITTLAEVFELPKEIIIEIIKNGNKNSLTKSNK